MRWRVWRDLSRGSGQFVTGAAVCMVASTIGTALAVRLSGDTIDQLLAGDEAVTVAMLALVAGMIGSAAWSASDLAIAQLATDLAVRLRATMVRHTMSLPIGFFTDRSVGEVTDRISTDVDSIASGVVNQVKPIAMGLLGALVALVMSLTVDVRLTVLFVPAAVAIVWSGIGSGRRVASGARELQSEWAEAAGTAEEAFGAREDLRQVLGRGLVMRRWAEHGTRIWGHIVQLGRDRNRLTLSTVGLLRLFQLAVLVAGSTLAVRGELEAGDVWAAFGLVTLFSRRIEEVLNSLPKLTELIAASQRVDELLHEEPEPATTAPAAVAGAVDWREPVAIEFNDVSFAYGDGPAVLTDVTFTVRAGRSLAVVGRTGSGKSTLVRLVNRSLATPPGRVHIGGVDVCAIELTELRRNIGVVSQRVELLRASLRDNVTLFDPTISDDRVLDSFNHLGLTRWLAELPAGIDTVLGDGGVALSAGQEQLVAFARLLVRNPAVVVLDEATARLDPGTERLLQAATDRLLAGRTSIIIAHRLATIAGVDDVLVLEGGRVVEHGGRRALLERDDSAFARLVEAAGGLEVRDVVEAHDRADDTGRALDTGRGTDADRPAAPVPTVASTTWRLACRHPRAFVPGTLGWFLFFMAPAVTAWVWAGLVPHLVPGGDIGPSITVFAVAGAVGLAGKLIGERFFTRWWMLSNITLRSNILAAQLHPHDERVGHHPPSPGDAVSRMWDTNDLINYTDHWVDLASAVLFLVTATALSGMWSTLPWLAAPILVPAAVAVALRHRVGEVATEHARLRGIWSGRVAEVCAAATTIKGFGAEPHVIVHLDDLTERRQRAALGQRRLELVMFGSVFLTSEAGQRLVLLGAALTAAAATTTATLTAAQVGTAVAISEAIGMMPIGGIIACMIIQEVPMLRSKLARMARLLPARDDFDLTRPPEDLQLPPADPVPVPTERPQHAPLEQLTADGLTVIFDDGTVGIDDVSFTVHRGELVIVTGPIAAGKSTLLRVLAGLCPASTGSLFWDGELITDASAFLRPPTARSCHRRPGSSPARSTRTFHSTTTSTSALR